MKIKLILFIFLSFCASLVAESSRQEKKQTICLNMIVKNESKAIQRCLESVKPLIDYWVISDTGSTDGTQQIIRNTLRNIPGELHEHAWKDFAYNRNKALELAKEKGDYVLFIDADEVFVYSDHFRMPLLDKDYYFFSVINERGGISLSEYKRILLIDNRLDWKWEGVLHEMLVSSQAKQSAEMKEIVNISRTEDGSRFQDPKKFLNDAKILEKALETEPNNTRYVFYTARSYLNANEKEKALKFFEKRVAMEPDRVNSAEIFTSLYCIGTLQKDLQMPSDRIIDSLTRAYQYAPFHAEPLYWLGDHFLSRGNCLLAELLLKKALTIPLISLDAHTFETWIYSWGIELKLAECMFKLAKFDESKTMIEHLLSNPKISESCKSFLRANLAEIRKIQESAALR